MKRLVVALAIAALALLAPSSVSAAPAVRSTETWVALSCQVPAVDSPAVAWLDVGANQYDAYAQIMYWSRGNTDRPIDLMNDEARSPSLIWDGAVLSGTIPLMDRNEDPARDANLRATLVPDGDADVSHDRYREGNRWVEETDVNRPMRVAGTLIVGSARFPLDGCFALVTTVEWFSTNPTAYAAHYVERYGECEVQNRRGDMAYVWFWFQRNRVDVDVSVFPARRASTIQLIGAGRVHGRAFRVSLGEDPELGDRRASVRGSIDVSLGRPGPVTRDIWRMRGERFVTRSRSVDVEGTLRVGRMTFALDSCRVSEVRSRDLFTAPRGPKPGGNVPANDPPAGARLLRVGDRASVWTKGAAEAAEASFPCLDPVDFDEMVQPVHTVWYRFQGTGQRLVLDTAGSRFDTVLAVYRKSADGRLVPRANACVDNLENSLEAAVSFSTAAGAQYYVQVGGYPGWYPYGRLRISLR